MIILRIEAEHEHLPPTNECMSWSLCCSGASACRPRLAEVVPPATSVSNVSFQGFHGGWLRVKPDGNIDFKGVSPGRTPLRHGMPICRHRKLHEWMSCGCRASGVDVRVGSPWVGGDALSEHRG